ncbi:hypothetical protein DV738_g2050, partial [Chaetothyriales sp. CBS 135597]
MVDARSTATEMQMSRSMTSPNPARLNGEAPFLSVILQTGPRPPRTLAPNLTRRSHKKSRAGCYMCKSRKIKCGEQKPRCTNCLVKGLKCLYPVIDAHKRRDAPVPLAKRELSNMAPAVATFSILDMRFFHHFMTTAYPHLPLGNDHIWVNEVPLFAEGQDYLMHAILSLGASHLGRLTGVDYRRESLTHRGFAIAGLNQALSQPAKDFGQADAMLAACYALTFQASYMGDGLFDFITMVRGCALTTAKIKQEDAMTAFNLEADSHYKIMAPRMHRLPSVNPCLAEGGIEALAKFRAYMVTQLDKNFHEALQNVLRSLLASPRSGYQEFIGIYSIWYELSHDSFRAFLDPDNIAAQLLLAYFIALQMIMVPLAAYEWPQRANWSQAKVLYGAVEWAQGLFERLDDTPVGEHLMWPKQIVGIVVAELGGYYSHGPRVLRLDLPISQDPSPEEQIFEMGYWADGLEEMKMIPELVQSSAEFTATAEPERKEKKMTPFASNNTTAAGGPVRKSAFERQKDADAKKAREEAAATAAALAEFERSFEDDGGSATFTQRHGRPAPGFTKKRQYDDYAGKWNRQSGGRDERFDHLSPRRGSDEHAAPGDPEAARPTLHLSNLPPGTSPAVVKALMVPSPLVVEDVRILPGASADRKAMSALVTLATETPATDIDTLVSQLQNKYLGFGFYLSLSRHLSSAALTGAAVLKTPGGGSTNLPFGARPIQQHSSLSRAPPPGQSARFAPPTSYTSSSPYGSRTQSEVIVQPPTDLKQLKLIHKTLEALLTYGPEFEALLMSRPQIQKGEEWAWLWDARSQGGVYYRWRLWQTLTGSGNQGDDRVRYGSRQSANILFEGQSPWIAPEQGLKFEYVTELDEFVSDEDYNSSEEEDDEDYGLARRHNDHVSGGHGGQATSTTDGNDDVGYLNPLGKAKLMHLLSRLPDSIARLRRGDVARVTAFAIEHAGAGAPEVASLLTRNAAHPFSSYRPSPTSEKSHANGARPNEDEKSSPKDLSSACLVGLYIISDILSCSANAGVRHAWRYRVLFENALSKQKVFGRLGRLEKDLGWGKLKADKWKRSIQMLLNLWEGWSVFPHDKHEAFLDSFLNTPLTEAELAAAQAEAERKAEQAKESKNNSKWKSVEDDGIKGAVSQDVQMQDVDASPGADDADLDGVAMDEDGLIDDDIDGVSLADNKIRTRVDYSSLTKEEQKSFVNAYQCLLNLPSNLDQTTYPAATNRYFDYAIVHVNRTQYVHISGFFLTWHRYFIHLIEQDLRNSCGYTGRWPYWNYAATAGSIETSAILNGDEYSLSGNGIFNDTGPIQLGENLVIPHGSGGGCVTTGPFANLTLPIAFIDPSQLVTGGLPDDAFAYNPSCLRRDLNNYVATTYTNQEHITKATHAATAADFELAINGILGSGSLGVHSGAHFEVGGQMNSIHISAQDPVWYPLHTFIDLLYDSWQRNNPDVAYDLHGTGTALNNPPTANVTLDSIEPDWGYFQTEPIQVRDLVSTTKGPFCYQYDVHVS